MHSNCRLGRIRDSLDCFAAGVQERVVCAGVSRGGTRRRGGAEDCLSFRAKRAARSRGIAIALVGGSALPGGSARAFHAEAAWAAEDSRGQTPWIQGVRLLAPIKIQGVRLLAPIKESDPLDPRRRERLNADPKVLAFWSRGRRGTLRRCRVLDPESRSPRPPRAPRETWGSAAAHGAVPWPSTVNRQTVNRRTSTVSPEAGTSGFIPG
jgi:hypothetical protein